MIKALFFDIDGTLVSFKTHRIPQSTIDALTAAKANGIEIYISTGRPFRLINNIGEISHLIDGYITANGAYCFTGTTVVACNAIPGRDVAKIVCKAKAVGFPCMVVGVNDLTMYNTESKPEEVMAVSDMLDIDVSPTLPVESVMSQGVIQLTAFFPESEDSAILGNLEGIEYSRWYPTFTDITARGVSKAKGMEEFARYRGFDISATMAFGDGGNDLSMIMAAGIGVAMGNAGTILKNEADYVTTSVDDNGISNALRHFKVI